MDIRECWIWIAQVFGPANHRVWDLTKGYDDIKEFCQALMDGRIDSLNEKEKRAVRTTHIEQTRKLIEFTESKGMNILTYDDISYPQRLRDIYNPPTVLFCYGNLDYVDDSITLAVVGAREPSQYSVEVAQSVCTELAKVGTVLVSGFAYGIDSIAHKCALLNKSRTIAVLGCGLDYDYPPENAKLKKIVAKDGAVISEFFPGTKPFRDNFRQRNRIISGLSLGVLVVEASSSSGSLSTASHALSQGKDIFCIPTHDVLDERYAGNSSLMRDGAIPVFSHLDIVYEYFENFSHKADSNNAFEDFLLKRNTVPDSRKDSLKRKSKVNMSAIKKYSKPVAEEKSEIDVSALNETQKRIVSCLKERIMYTDELAVTLKIDISELLTELTELEIDGTIKALSGKRYSL